MKACDQALFMLLTSFSIRRGQMEYRQVQCHLRTPQETVKTANECL